MTTDIPRPSFDNGCSASAILFARTVVCMQCAMHEEWNEREGSPLYEANILPYSQHCHVCGNSIVQGLTPKWPELFVKPAEELDDELSARVQPKFPHLVHTVALAEGARAVELVCTIAGFNSRAYAEEFAQKHSSAAAGLTDRAIVVTGNDVADGILSAFVGGKSVSLLCPCIGECRHEVMS
jgi:hypothetical protein